VRKNQIQFPLCCHREASDNYEAFSNLLSRPIVEHYQMRITVLSKRYSANATRTISPVGTTQLILNLCVVEKIIRDSIDDTDLKGIHINLIIIHNGIDFVFDLRGMEFTEHFYSPFLPLVNLRSLTFFGKDVAPLTIVENFTKAEDIGVAPRDCRARAMKINLNH
jgi:hypothetical protein